MDKGVKIEERNPSERANLFSIVTFAWLWKFFLMRSKRELAITDLFSPLDSYASQFIGDKLEKKWQQEGYKCKKKNPSVKPKLWRTLFKCFKTEIFIIGILQFTLEFILTLPQPFILGKLLKYFHGSYSISKTEAYYWAGLFTVVHIIKTPFFHFSLNLGSHLGMKMRVSCSSLIYRKVLKTSKLADSSFSDGQVMNLLTNDVNTLNNVMQFFHFIWMAPILLLIITYILYSQMQLPIFTGIGISILIFPLQYVIGKIMRKSTIQAADKTDKRLQLMNEIISGVQVIKMYTWEKYFSQLIDKIRVKEATAIKKINFTEAIAISFEVFGPKLCTYLTIVTFVLTGNNIIAEKIFMTVAFFNNLGNSINIRLPIGVQWLAKALGSLKRVEEFLELEEIQYSFSEESENRDGFYFNINTTFTKYPNALTKNISAKGLNTLSFIPSEPPNVNDLKYDVVLRDASINWCPQPFDKTPEIINFTAKHGALTAVVGPVGSGKTSLFHAILGELALTSGSLLVTGKLIYVSQEPWIFTSSVRQNILFGKVMDKQRYDEVIKACQLKRDFQAFFHKDQTIIGEKGINLSGGQKARINLARAIYADADVYLLDDPLSAVDTHVGRSLFETCICKYLKGKTRILVTHHLQFLSAVDYVYVMNKGTVKISGTFPKLKKSKLDFLTFLQASKDIKDDKKDREIEYSSDSVVKDKTSEEERQEDDEHMEFGKISQKVYLSYIKSVGNMWCVALFFILLVLWQLIMSGGDIMLSKWTDAENIVSTSTNETQVAFKMNQRPWYIYVYSAFIVGAFLLTYLKLFLHFTMCWNSSKNLHFNMFYNIIRATMSFFHSNSLGRIMNRFSQDIGQVDKNLPPCIIEVLDLVCFLIAVMVMTFIINFWMLIPTIIIVTIFYCSRSIYIKTSRNVKRLQGITRSPVFSHLSATLQGLATIRAFKAQKILTEEFDNHQDLNSASWHLFISCSTAFSYYIELTCTIYLGIVIFSFLLLLDNESIGNVGLIIIQTVTLSELLQWGIIQATEVEAQMTSVERIIEYTNVATEFPVQSKQENKPPKNWPSEGGVEFRNVCLKYSEKDHFVLKHLNFIIKPKEKIGIVGRTGSGKSSLINALFRLAYLDGEIFIDDVATSKLGLQDLRSKISIIPQEPFLFSATLRENLDPFQEFSDDELWNVLEEVQLKRAVVNSGLNGMISDGGTNFSTGQRQLLCLARAVLKKNKLLVLDEATANVDPQTDALIQETIRKRFGNCTVFIIAHRLNTVMDCDKFIVMDAGHIVEFDHPHTLLQRKEGYLFNMVYKTGSKMANILSEMALTSHDSV